MNTIHTLPDTVIYKLIKRCKLLLCLTTKLKEHFVKHLNRDTEKETPLELEITPKFRESLREQQGHVNIDPPTSKELLKVIRKLKNAANDISAKFISCNY